MISISNADIGYGKKNVLKNVSCSIQEGENIGLVGPNGCGKTTFLRAVLGLIKPSSGQVEVDHRKKFGYVPQAENINPLWPVSVHDVVSIAIKSKRFFSRITSEDRKNIDEAMQKTSVDNLANQQFSELSGGQRQRTILAQALSLQPDVLLLDEPTRGLDVVVERDFLNLIKNLQKEINLTILFVTHSLHIPLNFSNHIFLFKEGRVSSSTIQELTTSKKLEEIYRTPFLHAEKKGIHYMIPEGFGR